MRLVVAGLCVAFTLGWDRCCGAGQCCLFRVSGMLICIPFGWVALWFLCINDCEHFVGLLWW